MPATRRRPTNQRLRILGASEHNLKDIDVEIPLGVLTCVTGVSGSGKSTLVHDVIYAAIKRAKGDWDRRVGAHRALEGAEFVTDVVLVDQQPIGRTPRSNPVTYLKAFDPIRELFAATKDAKARGLTASHFSFNVPGRPLRGVRGRRRRPRRDAVPRRRLRAVRSVRRQALPARRSSRCATRGKNIDQVLDLTVREALAFFAGHAEGHAAPAGARRDRPGLSPPRASRRRRCRAARRSASRSRRTWRRRAASGCSTSSTSRRPACTSTTSSSCSRRSGKLLAAGHSLLVIEHNLDVLKTADWIIDLGPEGGEAGGHIVAAGTPEQVRDVEPGPIRGNTCAVCSPRGGNTRSPTNKRRRGLFFLEALFDARK